MRVVLRQWRCNRRARDAPAIRASRVSNYPAIIRSPRSDHLRLQNATWECGSVANWEGLLEQVSLT